MLLFKFTYILFKKIKLLKANQLLATHEAFIILFIINL